MGKKKPHPSLQGKKPVNKANLASSTSTTVTTITRNPSHISNKMKRSEMYGKYLQTKRALKKKQRLEREKNAEALGEDKVPPKQTPKTIDNTREVDPTMITSMNDPEIVADEADDEFASYFHSDTPPKVLVTTRPFPSRKLFFFIADLQNLIPALHYYPRKKFSVKEICQFATNRNFSHLMILSENQKHCNGMTISHLKTTVDEETGQVITTGPTAFFKVSSVVTSQNIPNHGASTNHIPELNLHGFGTRLGHRIGRLLGSLFPHDAQFQGRQVVTFHNQRDYIFVRHHRYIFEEKKKKLPKVTKKKKGSEDQDNNKQDEEEEQQNRSEADRIKNKVKARLQELGPRFTLKLRWIQEGTFDTQFGEYEWIHKRKEMDTTRRRFHL